MSYTYSLYINGEFRMTKANCAIINPATQEPVASVAVADESDVDAAISSARAAFDKGPWPRLPLSQRKEFILKISQGILEKAQVLSRLETLNTGKPIKESTFMDIPSAAETFKYFAENLEGFLADETREIATPIAQAQGLLVREPVGVVAIIVPWNYPLLIAAWKIAPALAAGNTVVVKPSSLTPLTLLEFAKIIDEAGIPKGVVNIINGPGSGIGKLLCSDKRVDMISFTGSNEVGKQIVESTGKDIKKSIMELGGKSAGLVLKDADMELAVNGLLCSIFLNQGQMCTAMSRILVEDAAYDDFLNDFVAKAKRIKLGEGLDYETQMGPLISEEQRRRVVAYVEKAKQEGAQVLCGGKIPTVPSLDKGFFFEPAIITGVNPGMSIFQEEVFGPVVCVSKFATIDEAVDLANKSDFALAACIWGKDVQKAKSLAQRINAGTVWINTYGMFFNELPYGGFKQSGFGKELGKEGFLEYTRLKNIVSDCSKDSKPLVNYWYGF